MCQREPKPTKTSLNYWRNSAEKHPNRIAWKRTFQQAIKHGGGCRSIMVHLCFCSVPHHQVCLSLLGTWAGPGWDPNHSTLLQDRRGGRCFFGFQTHMEISRVNLAKLAKCYMIFDAVIFRKILKGMGFQLVLRAWALVFAMYRGIWTCMAGKSAIADAYLFQGCSNWHTKCPNTIV